MAANLVVKIWARFGVQLSLLEPGSPDAARRLSWKKSELVQMALLSTDLHGHVPACGAWFPGYRALGAVQAESIVKDMPSAKLFFFDRVSRSSLALAKACAEREP